MITEHDRKLYPYHDDDAIMTLKIISGLHNDVLSAMLDEWHRLEDLDCYKALIELIDYSFNNSTSPSWLRTKLSDEMLDRGLVDGKQYHKLKIEVSG